MPSPEFGAPRPSDWAGMPLPSRMPSPELGAGPLLTANAINVAINVAIVPITLPFCELDSGSCCCFVSHAGGCLAYEQSRDHAHHLLVVWGAAVSWFREPAVCRNTCKKGSMLPSPRSRNRESECTMSDPLRNRQLRFVGTTSHGSSVRLGSIPQQSIAPGPGCRSISSMERGRIERAILHLVPLSSVLPNRLLLPATPLLAWAGGGPRRWICGCRPAAASRGSATD